MAVSIDTSTAIARFLCQYWRHTYIHIGLPWVFAKHALQSAETTRYTLPVPIPTTKRKCIGIIGILNDGDGGWSH